MSEVVCGTCPRHCRLKEGATGFCRARKAREGRVVAANYGKAELYAALGAGLGFALFALGVFPPARRAAVAVSETFRCIFVKIRRFRWIKVIFR